MQAQGTFTFFLQVSVGEQGPGWQVRGHLWEHSRSLGHWSPQHSISTLAAPEAAASSPHFRSRFVRPQWHLLFTMVVQGAQGGGWQGRGQGWGQAGDRGTRHSDSHFLQLLPAEAASAALRTLWQSRWQVWLPQGRLRPQRLPQGAGLAAWHGQAAVS